MNQNIDGANHVKWSESKYRWSESPQVLCSLVKPLKPNIGVLVISSQEVSMINGAKPEIEGVNHDIDGAKCEVVEYFVVESSQI